MQKDAASASFFAVNPSSQVVGMFVDRVRIEAVAGKGGDGCMSFRRERFVPKGGPDGGDGGNGGDVVIVAKNGINSLVNLNRRKQWKAERGVHGSGSNRHGKSGRDEVIHVPPGTVIIDAGKNYVIKDLACDGDSVIAARGGKGGKGNTRFKSATNQAPRTWTPGTEGESRELILELKVIADVGLVGKPNAGKSTLLSRISSARPEIADYPFTTKYPNLGMVEVDWNTSFVVADIPGLIEGAADGVGLGHDFLKHIERSGILVHLVEPQPMDESDPIENYCAIRKELEKYKVQLIQRPEILVVTKADLPETESVKTRLANVTEQDVYLISAVTGQGLQDLIRKITEVLKLETDARKNAKVIENQSSASDLSS
jgi:GTP-binding protein